MPQRIDVAKAENRLRNETSARPQGMRDCDIDWICAKSHRIKTAFILGRLQSLHRRENRRNNMRAAYRERKWHHLKETGCNRPRKGQQQAHK